MENARAAKHWRRASIARLLEELGARLRVGEEIHRVAHEYPERIVELHFFRCDLLDEPRPVLGQEMRWVARTELATLDFPPADADLIALLTHRGIG